MKRVLLRHKLQVLRRDLVDDGLQRVEVFAPVGPYLWAAREDVSDGERLRSGSLAAEITARFRIRRSVFADTITAKDRLLIKGEEWGIVGPPKLTADDRMLEISAMRGQP